MKVGITHPSPDSSRPSFELADRLKEHGYAVVPTYLSDVETAALRASLLSREEARRFHRAGIGKQAHVKVRDDIRKDEISWIEAGSSAAEDSLLARLATLKDKLNRELLLGLWDVEAHFAIYPPGGFYRRHLDRFSGDLSGSRGGERTVSVVLYLNHDWNPEQGGELALFDRSGAEILVEPVGGTLVCFLSAETEHEVRETREKDRLSIAAWFRTRASSV